VSEISKIYAQYDESLTQSQEDYDRRLKTYAQTIRSCHDAYLQKYLHNFSQIFQDQVRRLEIRRVAENFFGTLELPFVAIDGSCDRRESVGFISFFGGAYGSRGVVSLSGPEGKLSYRRWEFNRDVSMVAFVPIPPDSMQETVDEYESESSDNPQFMTDAEIAEMSYLHTKIMQLAEVYLAYNLAKSSTIEAPRIILIDNSLSGILGNTSFDPKHVKLVNGDFGGESVSLPDLHIALAHPFNRELGVPSTKKFQVQLRVIAEAVWRSSRTVRADECTLFPLENFERGARALLRISAGEYDESSKSFTFRDDPRASWSKTVRIFERICDELFRKKSPSGLTYQVQGDDSRRNYFCSRDIAFLIGVGIRALIETCWDRRILLVGVVKDSSSRYFYRNFVGSMLVNQQQNPTRHLSIPLTDRSILELIPHTVEDICAPWATCEFDSCFMTLHPELVKISNSQAGETLKWVVKGYEHFRLGETTRPERVFLRSIAQFLLSQNRSIASHSIFVDRLVYDNWDNADSCEFTLNTPFFGTVRPLSFDKPSRLQTLMMYLLSVLVRNHFPEALGYPDPLHKADWGAKSMRRRVTNLLQSSEWAHRAHPLYRTFRDIRESTRR
jgi:hypothetical protein